MLEDEKTYSEHDMYVYEYVGSGASGAKRNNIRYTDNFVLWLSAPVALADGQLNGNNEGQGYAPSLRLSLSGCPVHDQQ